MNICKVFSKAPFRQLHTFSIDWWIATRTWCRNIWLSLPKAVIGFDITYGERVMLYSSCNMFLRLQQNECIGYGRHSWSAEPVNSFTSYLIREDQPVKVPFWLRFCYLPPGWHIRRSHLHLQQELLDFWLILITMAARSSVFISDKPPAVLRWEFWHSPWCIMLFIIILI